ncbi:hypothetical protein Q7F05_00765 [Pseudomonas sp. Lb2C1-1]|uniref:hypothetical protein n=1 Tax=Pseudomonas TaxID=286 RepID=UPI00391BCADD
MLRDLDELVLSCEDPRSRKYIEEAVTCYKAGAYRSSVVACWIAVAFDLVDKIRELAAGGDKQAQAEITRFEQIQKANNLPGALNFEKELPLMAKDKFEFISHLEYLDIMRLVEDRNRCAHPSQVSDNEVFSASAELARVHIFNAVSSILSKPASQGKAALERVLNDIESKFFPNEVDDVITLFEAGPLKRCRDSLFSNLLRILIKTVFVEEEIEAKFKKCRLALLALKCIQPNLWERFFADSVKQIIERMRTDDELCRAVVMVVRLEKLGLWNVLSKADQLRLLTFVENAPPALFNDFDWFYISPPVPAELVAISNKRIMKATHAEIDRAGWLVIPPIVIDRLMTIYCNSASFAEANTYGRTLRQMLQDLEPTYKQVSEIVRMASKNDQIKHSNELPNVLRQLDAVEGGRETVAQLMLDHGLEVII